MPFRDVVGHVRLIDLLSRSIAGRTLPPSLLFAGPAGIGKRLTALAVAQALNCTHAQGSGFTVHGSGADACGVCPACTRIARGVHPDVLFVSPGESGAIKIDQVRDIVDRAQIVLEKAASQPDPARRIESAQQLITKPASGLSERDQLATHLRAMAVLLRDVEVLATGADERTLANADVRPALERLSATYRGERGTRAFAAVDRALFALQRNAGVKLVADWLGLPPGAPPAPGP